MTLPAMYKDAPKKVQVGRIILLIGCIVCFIAVIVHLSQFIYYLVPKEKYPTDWEDPSIVIDCVSSPFLAVFYLLAGIGGLCFIFDKYRMKVFCSLAGVISLAVLVLGTVGMFYNLIKSGLAKDANLALAFGNFFGDIISIQLSGGIYFIGWFLCKDYTGD